MPSENAAPAVETRAVSRQYGYLPALRAVSLDIGQGECVAFFGHNGAGKTTMLRLIATHLRPSSGTIRIFGNDVPACGPGIKRRIGLLTHENYLYPELSIRENLQFYARLFSIDDEENYQDLVDYFGLRRWYTAGWEHCLSGSGSGPIWSGHCFIVPILSCSMSLLPGWTSGRGTSWSTPSAPKKGRERRS